MNADAVTEQQLAILRYIRDHAVATAETISREVLGAPVTTFGRTLRRRPAERELATLVEAGFLSQNQQARHAEFMLTHQGRALLRGPTPNKPTPGADP